MSRKMDEFEDFDRREEFEEPDPGYEQDSLLMCEKEIDFVDNGEPPPAKGEKKANSLKKDINPGKEDKMGFFGKKKRDDDVFEAAEEDIRQMDAEYRGEECDDAEEEPAAPKPVRKKTAKGGKVPAKKKKGGMKLILLAIVLLLLIGGGYAAWEMFMAPAPMPQQAYRPPVKQKIHPQERKASAKPVPARAAAQRQQGQPQSAAELVMMESNGKQAAVAIVENDPAPKQARNGNQPVNPAQTAQPAPLVDKDNDEVSKGLKDIGKQLDDIRKSLDDLRGMVNASVLAGTPKGGDVPREVLKGMTAEIQSLSAKNKSLSAEIDKAQKKIAELRGIIAKNKGGKSVAEKKSEPKKDAKKSGGADASGWEILGFSGNRVVIADERGTHSINVGQSYNGVKIISVDVEGGSVKTSAGTLKYGQ